MANNPKYLFRMSHKDNIATFVEDRALFAPNYRAQPQWSICYDNIVKRRNDSKHSISDNVAFYFSPLTAMSYAISQKKVDLSCPENKICGKVDLSDVVYIVVDIDVAIDKYDYKFTDHAYNEENEIAKIYSNWSNDSDKIDWVVFNEGFPNYGKAEIDEIDYGGANKLSSNHQSEERWHNRKSKRMAEFWIEDQLHFSDIKCLVVKTENLKNEIETMLKDTEYDNIPVYCKPNVYY